MASTLPRATFSAPMAPRGHQAPPTSRIVAKIGSRVALVWADRKDSQPLFYIDIYGERLFAGDGRRRKEIPTPLPGPT